MHRERGFNKVFIGDFILEDMRKKWFIIIPLILLILFFLVAGIFEYAPYIFGSGYRDAYGGGSLEGITDSQKNLDKPDILNNTKETELENDFGEESPVKEPEDCSKLNLIDLINGKCIKKTISVPNYDCTFCHGLCYVNNERFTSLCTSDGKYFEFPKDSDYGKLCQTNPECANNEKCIEGNCLTDLFDEPWGLPIKVNPIYPRSVAVGEDFNFIVNVKNKNDEPVQITIDYVVKFLYEDSSNGEPINFQETKEIIPNSDYNFEILIPAFEEESSNAGISFNIKLEDNEIIYHIVKTGLIIVYDSQYEANCGNLKFNSKNAVCINDILYPTTRGYSCYSNEDCAGESVCLNYNCLSPDLDLDIKSEYRVGIVSSFIYEDEGWYENEKIKREIELRKMADDVSEWFDDERVFQNAQNNFSIDFEFYQACAFTLDELLAITKTCESWNECEKKELIECGVDLTKYDIIAKTGYDEPEINFDKLNVEWNRIGVFGVAGINFGRILLFSLGDEAGIKDRGALIHETLHSFGLVDLYSQNGRANSLYQERNCNLFKANWQEFKEYPHLCDFESKVLGWKS